MMRIIWMYYRNATPDTRPRVCRNRSQQHQTKREPFNIVYPHGFHHFLIPLPHVTSCFLTLPLSAVTRVTDISCDAASPWSRLTWLRI